VTAVNQDHIPFGVREIIDEERVLVWKIERRLEGRRPMRRWKVLNWIFKTQLGKVCT